MPFLQIFFQEPIKTLTIFAAVALFILWMGFTIIRTIQTDKTIMPKITDFIDQQPKRDVHFGFWTYGLWDDNSRSLQPDKLRILEKEIGKKAAIAHYFRGWHHLDEASLSADLNTLSNEGWRPMLSANPYFFEGCTAAKGVTLYKAIWLGNCDEFLHRVAKNLKKVEQPFFFRFAWEMNVDTMEWSISQTGSYTEEYVNAWRRFHDILKEEGVTNVIWVFSPQVETPTSPDIAKLYPGDDYVDWVGLDGYNWGETRSWSNWQSFKEVFYKSYLKLNKLASTKPFMIAEVNTVDVGGDRGEWYKKMLSEEIPNDFPEIDAIVFFNEDKTKQEGINWLIDNKPTSLQMFKEGIANPIYKSNY